MKRKFKPRYKKVAEKDIENYLVKEVEKMGGMCTKGNAKNNRGCPDRLIILPSGFVAFVEVKRPGLKPRPDQRLYIKRLLKRGHMAAYVDDFHRIDAIIKFFKQKIKNYKQGVSTKRLCDRYECDRRIKT